MVTSTLVVCGKPLCSPESPPLSPRSTLRKVVVDRRAICELKVLGNGAPPAAVKRVLRAMLIALGFESSWSAVVAFLKETSSEAIIRLL